MAYSVVQICNIALTALNSATISNITEDSKGAKVCNALYDITKDMLLREHTWNFAMKRDSLQLDTTTPAFEFPYQFDLPADYLRVVRAENSTDKFRVEGKKLLANRSTFNIQYISADADEADFDPVFANLLAMEIAVQAGPRLGASKEALNGIERRREQLMDRAKMADRREGTPQELHLDTWADARIARSNYIFRQGK